VGDTFAARNLRSTTLSSSGTIFALSTPPGRSAIAVVRLSGEDVPRVLETLAGAIPPPRHAALRRLRDPRDASLIDEALVLYFPSPRSETGEHLAEFQLHGGRAVVRAVLEALALIPGCRPAEPGEFARRALANGKLDLAEVEGLADLIDAETEAQRRQAICVASGVHSAVYEGWRANLLGVMALVEAAIDFSDESEIAELPLSQALAMAITLSGELASHLADGHRGEIVRDGYRVVLAGPPNAGKSSLLNALARRDAAIVSDEAGTTRDVIEVRLDLGGWPVMVTDTAGLRETTSKVEQEGIRRTIAEARRADLVLWLVEPGGPPQPEPDIVTAGVEVMPVETKSDLLTAPIHVKHDAPTGVAPLQAAHRISTQSGAGLDALIADLTAKAAAAAGTPGETPITRIRHRREIESAHGHLRAFADDLDKPLELRAEDLRLAASAIGRLTGRIGAEDVLGEIFGRFCIGK
jgi:tRNA modification GTPase